MSLTEWEPSTSRVSFPGPFRVVARLIGVLRHARRNGAGSPPSPVQGIRCSASHSPSAQAWSLPISAARSASPRVISTEHVGSNRQIGGYPVVWTPT